MTISEAAAAQLLIEVAFLLPEGTDVRQHPIAAKLLAFTTATRAAALSQRTPDTVLDVESGIRYVVMGLRHDGVDLALPTDPTKQVRWVRDTLFKQSFRSEPVAQRTPHPQTEEEDAAIKLKARQIAEMRENTNGATRDERIAALAYDIEQLALPAVQDEALKANQEEARGFLLIELLRFTKHRDDCQFFSEHRTHCQKWQGFHESRYVDNSKDCTCGAGKPCSCGLHDAQRAVADTYLGASRPSPAERQEDQ